MTTRLMRYLLTALLIFTSLDVAAKQVPIDAFFTHNIYSQPRLSPTGRYLSIVAPDPEFPERNLLEIVDLKSMKLIHVFRVSTPRDPFGNREVFERITWVSDQRLVFSTGFRIGGFDQPVASGKIYAIDVDGGSIRLLQANKSWTEWTGYGVIGKFADDSRHVVTSSYSRWNPPQAFIVNVAGNNGTLAATWGTGKNPNAHRLVSSPLENGDLMVDHAGQVRVARGYDVPSGRSVWAYRDSGSDDWRRLPQDLYAPDLGVGPIGFTPGNDKIDLLEFAPTGTLGLYHYDPKADTKTLVYADADNDINEHFFSSGIMYGPWLLGQRAFAVTLMPGRPKLVLLHKDGPGAKILKAFNSSFPHDYTRIVSWTYDGSEAVVSASGDRDPGTYYLVDSSTLHATPLFNLRPDIDSKDMASMKPITFKARDGMTIHGYLTEPQGATPDKLPMIVYVHGGPHGVRDEWGFEPWVQLLANRGYAVLQINYRGSAGYGWQYEKAGFRHWGTTMQYDVIDGTRWAIAHGIADSHRICIFGGSYGGFAALRSSELAPDLYRCTVGYDGVYDLPMMKKKGDITWFSAGRAYLDEVLGTDAADLADQSPVNHVDRLRGGLFLIQGGEDYRAPSEQVDELKAALDKAGKKYRYLYKPNEGHGFFLISDERELARKLLKFFDAYIGVDARATPVTTAGR